MMDKLVSGVSHDLIRVQGKHVSLAQVNDQRVPPGIQRAVHLCKQDVESFFLGTYTQNRVTQVAAVAS